jgi:hypothetical protein
LYVNTSSDVPNDDFSDSAAEGAKAQTKKDIIPNYEKCDCDSGMKHVSINTTHISEITELFVGNGFFRLLCKELNKYWSIDPFSEVPIFF